jgi:hypothetical protein
VLLVLTDDVGFGNPSTFGGPINSGGVERAGDVVGGGVLEGERIADRGPPVDTAAGTQGSSPR